MMKRMSEDDFSGTYYYYGGSDLRNLRGSDIARPRSEGEK